MVPTAQVGSLPVIVRGIGFIKHYIGAALQRCLQAHRQLMGKNSLIPESHVPLDVHHLITNHQPKKKVSALIT
jgi:hypothetical protein